MCLKQKNPLSTGRPHRYSFMIATFIVLGYSFIASAQNEDPAPEGDAPSKRVEFYLGTLKDANGQIPADGLYDAHLQRTGLLSLLRTSEGTETSSAGISLGSWSEIGPDNVGGRIRAIAVHPTIPARIFIGAASGGIWKSENSGASWLPIDDFLPSLSVSSLVFAPGNPQTMYASTGEWVPGSGIFKSTNGGVHWTRLQATTPTGSPPLDWAYVSDLAIHPNIATTLIAAIRFPNNGTGLRRSADSGTSWQSVGPVSTGFCNIAFDPIVSGRVAASSCGLPDSNVFISNDSGLTWTPSTGLFGPVLYDITFARSTSNLLFALSENGRLYKSTNGGASFSLTSGTAHFGSYSGYCNTLWVDPVNSSHIIAGGVHLYRSVDGGVSFLSLPNAGAVPHPDNHVIASSPLYNGTTNKRIYFAHDGGLSATDNVSEIANGVTSNWLHLTPGLRITQFYSGAGAGNLIVGGTQDNGTLKRESGMTWSQLAGGDGGMVNVPRDNANYMFGEYQNMQAFRFSFSPYFSSDLCSGLLEGACFGGSSVVEFIAPQVLDPNNSQRLYTGGQTVWLNSSLFPGSPGSWQIFAPPFTPTFPQTISAVSVAPGNSNIVWYAESGGGLFKTSNATSASPNFSQAAFSNPAGKITSIFIDKFNHSRVYVSSGGYGTTRNLLRTSDNGLSWQSVQGNLPQAPILWITQHPVMRDWLYVATDTGVYSSNNAGASWTSTSQGPGNVRVSQLSWTDDWTLLAATFGRGMFLANTSPVITKTSTVQPAVVGTQFSSPLTISVKDVDGSPLVGILISFTATVSSTGATATLSSSSAVTNASGVVSVIATANTKSSWGGPSGNYDVVMSLPTSTPQVAARYTLSNLAGPATSIVASPSSTPNGALVTVAFNPALSARVVDTFSNPISGRQVTFTAPASGASAVIASNIQLTQDNGWAVATAVANTVVGTYNVTASTPGISPSATFVLTNISNPSVSVVAGNHSTVVGAPFTAQPFAVQVREITGTPLAGVPVNFSAGISGGGATAQLSASQVVSNASGIASVTAVANTISGQYVVTASLVSGLSSVGIAAENLAGAPAAVSIIEGPNSAVVNTAFAAPWGARVTDQYLNPVPGVQLAFNTTLSGTGATAHLQSSAATTGPNGVAYVSGNAGVYSSSGANGGYNLVASVVGSSGISSEHSLTNLPGPLDRIFASPESKYQCTSILNPFPYPLRIKAVDSYGNPISGVGIAWFAPSSGPSLNWTVRTSTTLADGFTGPVSASANNLVGSYYLLAGAQVNLLVMDSYFMTNSNGTNPDVGVSLIPNGQVLTVRAQNYGGQVSHPVIARVELSSMSNMSSSVPGGCQIEVDPPNAGSAIQNTTRLNCAFGSIGAGGSADKTLILSANGALISVTADVHKLQPSCADGDAQNDSAHADLTIADES